MRAQERADVREHIAFERVRADLKVGPYGPFHVVVGADLQVGPYVRALAPNDRDRISSQKRVTAQASTGRRAVEKETVRQTSKLLAASNWIWSVRQLDDRRHVSWGEPCQARPSR
jgi:hypothetical protein